MTQVNKVDEFCHDVHDVLYEASKELDAILTTIQGKIGDPVVCEKFMNGKGKKVAEISKMMKELQLL